MVTLLMLTRRRATYETLFLHRSEAVWCNDAVTGHGQGARTWERISIIDVARDAGVSPATVSRVLNGAKPVSDALVGRVRESVERLGYRPNPAAQGLLRGRSHAVGVVVPDLSNPYFAEVLKGVTAAADELDRRTLIADTNENVADEPRVALELARWVDGLVLCSPRMSDAELRDIAASVPNLVCINRVLRSPAVAAIVVDFRAGMRAICNHLFELGHRRVAYLQGPEQAWSERQRQLALRAAARRGLQVAQVPCGTSTVDGYHATDAALAGDPTAIVAFSDYVAFGVLTRLGELDVAVPGDISVTGFDDIPMSGITSPGLTTVTVRKPLLGQLAWQRLYDGSDQAEVITVRPELVRRASTARPRRRGRVARA
jgi:LacI family transcriptional regulator